MKIYKGILILFLIGVLAYGIWYCVHTYYQGQENEQRGTLVWTEVGSVREGNLY